MKQLAVVTVLSLGGILAWLVASRLSSDALAMAVGLLFGVLAGIPTALLVLASQRRRRPYDDDADNDDDGARPVHVTYNVTYAYTDNRQLTINTSAPIAANPPFVADRVPLDAPTASGKTLPATTITDRLQPTD